MNEGNLTVTRKVHFSTRNRGRREIKPGPQPVPDRMPAGSVPRVSRLLALAIRFDDLIRAGAITDQADLARLGHVSRARVTQIMNLLHLAPSIQEEVLYLPRVTVGRDPITERHLRTIAAEIDGFSRKRGPDYVNGHAARRACRVVAVTRCPQRVTAILARRDALSVRSRDVRGPTVTRQVALEPRMKASRTLALSR